MKLESLIKAIYKGVYRRINSNTITDANMMENLVVNKALSMAKSKKVYNSMKNHGVINNLLEIYHWKSSKERRLYHFPKAFLFVGLTEYAGSRRDTILMKKISKLYEQYIKFDGTPSFNLNKVDQVPFSIAAINLYQYFGDLKYKQMADYTFHKLVSWADPVSKLIPYQIKSKIVVSDLLGMVCPFLVKYGTIFHNSDAIDLAYTQIHYYCLNGIDKDSHLPFHAIIKENKIKVGPTNWGRGVGWYILALSSYSKLEDANGLDLFKSELNKLIETLHLLKNNDSVWSQFPGSSQKFDASATTMFMYVINCMKSDSYTKEDLLKLLGKYIDKKGAIKYTSGETRGVHIYSDKFTKSEFSQGILLMLLSTI